MYEHFVSILELEGQVRHQQLCEIAHNETRAVDDCQVDREAFHAVSGTTALDPASDKREVEEGRVRVDELEEEDLRDHAVLELRVRAVVLSLRQGVREEGVDKVHHLNLHSVGNRGDGLRIAVTHIVHHCVAQHVDAHDDARDEQDERTDRKKTLVDVALARLGRKVADLRTVNE